MRATTSVSALFSPNRLLIAVGLAALVIVVAAAVASRQLEPRVHQAIVARLSTSLESTVELGDTRLSPRSGWTASAAAGRGGRTMRQLVMWRPASPFVLANGILTFKNRAIDVGGASIRTAGTCALEPVP